MSHFPEFLDPEDIACKMAAARLAARESETYEDIIPISRKGGLFGGKPFRCLQSVYDALYEGQLYTAFCIFEERERADTYRLQKDSAGEWELVWIKSYNV
jgi:hypothetical protein